MGTRLTVACATGALVVAGGLVAAAHTARSAPVTPIEPRATIAAAPLAGESSMVTTDGAIWIDTTKGVQRIDPRKNAVVATIRMRNRYGIGLAVGAGAVWAADFDKSVVRRIDPTTNRVVSTIKAGTNPVSLTFALGAVWVANHRGGSVSRIDPKANTVVATVEAGPAGPSGPQPIAAGFGDVWTGVPNINAVVRIDPVTNDEKATVKLPERTAVPCGPIAIVRSALWISACAELPTIAQIDPVTNTAMGWVYVGGWANGTVVFRGKAWYAVSGIDTGITPRLVRVEPGKRQPTAVRYLASRVKDPGAMLIAFGSLWLADVQSGTVLRFPASILK